MHARLKHVHSYCTNLQGDGVKVYLESGPNNGRAIAMFTYLDEDAAKSNKYYLQPYTESDDNSIIAKSDLGSSQPYIFQFRRV